MSIEGGHQGGADSPPPHTDPAVGVLAGDLQRLRNHMAAIEERQGATEASLKEFGDSVTQALNALRNQADESPERPLAWSQVHPRDLPEWLAQRVAWVNGVLLVDHEEVSERLRACWPLHPTLVNRLSLCEELHSAGMVGGALPTAQDFLRTLELTLEAAAHITKGCLTARGEHPPPRPLNALAENAERNAALMAAHTMFQWGAELAQQGDVTDAAVIRDGVKEILSGAQIADQTWVKFLRS